MTASSGTVRLEGMRATIPHRRVFATVLAAAVVVLALVLAAGAARAQDDASTQELFTARDVKVDVTAESAVAARDRALAEAQAKGLRQVLRDLVPASQQGSLPEVSEQEAQEYVLSLQVTDEKRSAVRYIATMTIMYNPDAVRQLMRQRGIAFTETARTPVLVVPLWQSATAAPPILWEDPNPWREVWARRASGGLTPTRVPLGDLGDLQAISADEAAADQTEAVRRLLGRYDMTEAVIAQAVRTGPDALSIDLSRFTLAGSAGQQTFQVTAGPSETQPELLARAADEVAARLREEWRAQAEAMAVSPDAAPSQLTVMIPTAEGLGAWLTVRDRLRQVPLVRAIQLQALTRERAQVRLGHVGDLDQLALSLAQVGLDMTDLGGGIWRIESRRFGAPTQAQPPLQPGAGTTGSGSFGAGAGTAPAPTSAAPTAAGTPGGPQPAQGQVLAPVQ